MDDNFGGQSIQRAIDRSKTVLVVENQSDNHLGRLAGLLDEASVATEIVQAHSLADADLKAEDYCAVISLGGDAGANDVETHLYMRQEMELLAAAHESGVPVLGICLGAQLLAKALGAEVEDDAGFEIGWVEMDVLVDDPLLGRAGPSPRFVWHHDRFGLPEGAVHVMRGKTCPNQAFYVGTSYGVQFHPEVSESHVAEWVQDPNCITDLERARMDGKELLTRVRESDSHLNADGRRLVKGFVQLIRSQSLQVLDEKEQTRG